MEVEPGEFAFAITGGDANHTRLGTIYDTLQRRKQIDFGAAGGTDIHGIQHWGGRGERGHQLIRGPRDAAGVSNDGEKEYRAGDESGAGGVIPRMDTDGHGWRKEF